nr:hypothetical protein [Morganella morganii]
MSGFMRTFITPLLLLFSASLFAATETKPAIPEKTVSADLDLVFVLDKSGSMSGFEQDTIGGYNSVLAENRKKRGIFTSRLFYSTRKTVRCITGNLSVKSKT